MDQSLFEQLGGKNTVEKAAHFLYVNILKDERIISFLKTLRLKNKNAKCLHF